MKVSAETGYSKEMVSLVELWGKDCLQLSLRQPRYTLTGAQFGVPTAMDSISHTLGQIRSQCSFIFGS